MLDTLASALAAPSATLVEESIKRAGAPQAAAVYIHRRDEAARREAKIADMIRGTAGAPRFTGVPITIKENCDLAGLTTSAGSKVLAGRPAATSDAPIVARLRQAGFVIMGRTNMSEFAFSGVGLNPHYGTPRNPAFADEDRVPGGSSSGAGVSVALGLVPVAIGTDTGGSVRIPAALTGIVGFKPTATVIPTTGIHPLSHHFDSVGVLANSVADASAVFDVLRGFEKPSRPVSLAGQRFGVIENYMRDGIEDYVARTFDAAVAKLAKTAHVVAIRLPEISDIPALFKKGSLVGAEGYAWHRDIIETRAHECDPQIVDRMSKNATMAAHDYIVLQQRRAAIEASVAAQVGDFDALLAPTVPIIAPRMDAVREDKAFYAANAMLLRNPTVINFLNGCAISLPCHAKGAAPVGLSVIGLGGHDDKTLRLAAAIEEALA